TVIVDEIHAVADDKRGAHLTLSLERLDALAYKPPVRIGLSATQKPIEEVARFLTGNRGYGKLTSAAEAGSDHAADTARLKSCPSRAESAARSVSQPSDPVI